MRDLAKRRIQAADRLFDAYDFGNWNLEEVSHWLVAKGARNPALRERPTSDGPVPLRRVGEGW
jgi:hypothetical protein